MSTEHDLDFSVGTVPDTWRRAEADAPKGDGRAANPTGPLEQVPTGRTADLATAGLAGVALSIAFGYAWYELATSAALTTPWLAAGLGVAVPVAVRLGGGAHDPQSRAILSLLLYLATWATVVFFIGRYLFADLYGSSPGLVEFERQLLHSRLAEPEAIVAWVVGAVAAVKVSYLLRTRR